MTDDVFERGMVVRRQVLGDAHVDRATASATDLTADFQHFITRYAWGEIWARPGLDRRTRSCITLAMLVALNRPEELELHVRAAVDERPDPCGDQGGAAADRRLLRCACGQRSLCHRPASPWASLGKTPPRIT